MKHGHGQRSQPGLHPCAGLGQFIGDNLALVNGAAIALQGHRDRIKVTRTLFKLSEVGEHDSKGFHGQQGFYAITPQRDALTSFA